MQYTYIYTFKFKTTLLFSYRRRRRPFSNWITVIRSIQTSDLSVKFKVTWCVWPRQRWSLVKNEKIIFFYYTQLPPAHRAIGRPRPTISKRAPTQIHTASTNDNMVLCCRRWPEHYKGGQNKSQKHTNTRARSRNWV